MIPNLKKLNYAMDEIFTWNNGGKPLQRKIQKYFLRVKLDDEFRSYLRYIHTARGGIYVPEELVSSNIRN